METTKPKWVLHSAYRSKCLGLSPETYVRLSRDIQIAAMFLGVQADTREDGVQSLSVLLSNAWDTFKPQNNEEAHALSFHCGVVYQMLNNRETALQVATLTSLILMLVDKPKDYFAKNANYMEFYEAAKEYMGEPPAVEHEVIGGAILEDLTMFDDL